MIVFQGIILHMDIVIAFSSYTCFSFFLIYFLRDGKGGRKRRETSVSGCLLHAPSRGLAQNPGMHPGWESNP